MSNFQIEEVISTTKTERVSAHTHIKGLVCLSLHTQHTNTYTHNHTTGS